MMSVIESKNCSMMKFLSAKLFSFSESVGGNLLLVLRRNLQASYVLSTNPASLQVVTASTQAIMSAAPRLSKLNNEISRWTWATKLIFRPEVLHEHSN